jgi:hypothetical protein
MMGKKNCMKGNRQGAAAATAHDQHADEFDEKMNLYAASWTICRTRITVNQS